MSKDDEASLLGIENESQLLELLKTRFLQDNVYNFIDDILISINPCKTLSSSHGKQQYLFQKVATSAINHLRLHNKNQCIVLTGDSGSGKTELSNKLTAFLTTTTKVTDCDLAQNIIQAGNVLESFGNACTLTSDNASRFIKFTELLFTEDVKLKGVYIHHYLLEKTRVVHHDKGEKNFHIFYQFLVGMAQENLEKYHLQPCVYHRYTGSDFDCTMEQDKYQDELTNLEECFKSLGFSHDNVETIFRVLAAILHIGDLTFSVKLGSKSVDVGDIETLRKASSLLRVSAEKLQFALVTEMTSVKGRLARRLRSISEASDARDMLSMALYTRVFAWIVWKINQYLAPMDVGTSGNTVSILDPFGFERLGLNGMEQLCINTTNEHLMFLYNQIVFAWETADQEAEGILIQKVEFLDNKDTIDFLMERPDGIFSLIDQESKSIQGGDASLVKKFSSKHRKHPCYTDVANSPFPAFTIKHFAGKVTYAALNVVARNRDMLGGSLITCLQESEDDLLCRLFMVKLSSTGAISRAHQHSTEQVPTMPRKAEIKKMRPTIRRQTEMIGNIQGITKAKVSKHKLIQEQLHLTLTSQFRNSLSDLMQRNLKSEMQFVRCIRPNQELIPNRYDDELVTAQLRYSCVMDTVRMRQQGFPVRIAFNIFIQRYKILSYRLTADVKYNADTCEKILSHVHGLGWRTGKTKVFMKNHCREQLDNLLDAAHRAVVIVQKLFRGRLARRWFKFLKYQQQREKHDVATFVSQVFSKMDNVYNHLCNQVSEEAKCSDIKPDEEIKERAIQILEGRKVRTKNSHTATQSQAYYPQSSTPIIPSQDQDTVDNQSAEQPSFHIDEELDISSALKQLSVAFLEGNDIETASVESPQVDASLPTENIPGSMDQSPLISITDIFNFGPARQPASQDTLPETTNQPGSVSDEGRDSPEDLSIHEPYSILDVFNSETNVQSPSQSFSEVADDGGLGTSAEFSIVDALTKSADESGSMTSPVRPGFASKESNLSTFSFETTLSPDGDMDVAMETPGLWCVITCFERDMSRGEFQVDRSVIIVDGSSNAFDVTRIGIGSLPMNPVDDKVEKVRRCIGKGIKLTIDVHGSMWAKRCSKNSVYVKGCFLSPEVKGLNGELRRGKLVKVFDFESFSNLLQYECDPMRYEPGKGEFLLSSTKVFFSFVKNALDDVDTPCWIEVKMSEPHRITEVALDVAKERRRIEREKRGERTPPILRAKIGKSRQIIAVGALEKQVRPQRYIDSFKYGRRGWARKKVSVNPFAFGNQDLLSPRKTEGGGDDLSRIRSQSSPEELESVSGTGRVDTSLDEVFGRSPSERATRPGQDLTTGSASGDVFDGSHERKDPGRKIWAKAKKAKDELKIKGKKRSNTTS